MVGYNAESKNNLSLSEFGQRSASSDHLFGGTFAKIEEEKKDDGSFMIVENTQKVPQSDADKFIDIEESLPKRDHTKNKKDEDGQRPSNRITTESMRKKLNQEDGENRFDQHLLATIAEEDEDEEDK